MYRNFLKPLGDFFVALLAFLILSPIIIITSVLLLIANRGNPFFFQKRPGLHGKIFLLIKFRTMNNRKDAAGNLLPDSERITKVGGTIRKLSLDELLQLINVLKGDMSIIGPRPLLIQYLPLYSAVQARRHSVRPGITGWAQVNGRNRIAWKQKFELDVWYVDHLSFALDMKILGRTIQKVVKRDGVNQTDTTPMEFFTGNN
jgi:undecaprenyl phosphate N,N'-diacetylbacillosamine 1-phosphate transferase